MKKIKTLIIGGGISGLYMGYLLRKDFLICEAKKREKIKYFSPISYLHKQINLPMKLKPIDIFKGILWNKNFHNTGNLVAMNHYAVKTIDKLSANSIKFIDGKPDVGYYPETNCMNDIGKVLENYVIGNIRYSADLQRLDTKNHIAYFACLGNETIVEYDFLITTIPLNIMFDLIYDGRDIIEKPTHTELRMKETQIWIIELDEHYDGCQIVYNCDIDTPIFRYFLIGNVLGIEGEVGFDIDDYKDDVEYLFMIEPSQYKVVELSSQRFIPIPIHDRKKLMRGFTEKYRIFCLGRYAVWDYKRFDHIVDDADTILKIIETLS